MSDTESFSVRVSPETRAKLDRLAASMERPRSYLVKEAINQYVAYHGWKAEWVAKGLAAAERGDFHDHDEVVGALRARIKDKRPPG